MFSSRIQLRLSHVKSITRHKHTRRNHNRLIIIRIRMVKRIALNRTSNLGRRNRLTQLITRTSRITFLSTVKHSIRTLTIRLRVTIIRRLANHPSNQRRLNTVSSNIRTTFRRTSRRLTNITTRTLNLNMSTTRLLFNRITMVTLRLLLNTRLNTGIQRLILTTLTILTKTMFTLIRQKLNTTPSILTRTTIGLMLNDNTFNRH